MRGAVVLLCAALLAASARAGPDAEQLGRSQGYPVGTAATFFAPANRVGPWSAPDRVPGVQVRRVPAAAQVLPLPPAADAPVIRYRFRNVRYTLQEYLERQRATGVLVLQNGRIVAEHYRYDRRDNARFPSFSMAKSVTSLLGGIALEQGRIALLDDPAARYARELEGTAYGATSIHNLLHMASGLTFTEHYDGNDDVSRMGHAFAMQGVYGQGPFVQPATGIVMVVTSMWQQPGAQQDPAPGMERNALWLGVLASPGGRTD